MYCVIICDVLNFALGLIFHVLQHQCENEWFSFSSRILTRGVIGKHQRMTAPSIPEGNRKPCPLQPHADGGGRTKWAVGFRIGPDTCICACVFGDGGRGVRCRNGESVGVVWLRFLWQEGEQYDKGAGSPKNPPVDSTHGGRGVAGVKGFQLCRGGRALCPSHYNLPF